MTILNKLHSIESKKSIYNIHYCQAGVGFIFYCPEKDPMEFREKEIVAGIKFKENIGWKKALSVEKYYPTFEEAVEEEYQKLKEASKQ